jgi:hypothetical protein
VDFVAMIQPFATGYRLQMFRQSIAPSTKAAMADYLFN